MTRRGRGRLAWGQARAVIPPAVLQDVAAQPDRADVTRAPAKVVDVL
jgi:hypothetical protein